MSIQVVARTLAASAVAVLIAGCGGGGSSDIGVGTTSGLQVTGTAATGAALVDADVQVKCASGTGTATTNSSGGYTVTVEGGALPCLVKVTGTTGAGVAITLHSVTETAGSDGKAVANVTPLTEMIVAQLTAALPSASFESFDLSTINATNVGQAVSAVVAALKTAGIDLGAIDPLKSELVPITATNTDGNAYDDALELLATKVSPEALPLLVTQIAAAAESGTSGALAEAMTAVSGGALANCPTALSGNYRTIDFRGATMTMQIDFSKMKAMHNGYEFTLAATSQACEITVDANGYVSTVAFGPNGVGLVHDNYTNGWIFPVQSLAYEDLVGEWRLVESGISDTGSPENFFGKVEFKADKSMTVCEYNLAGGVTSTCAPDPAAGTVVVGSDGVLYANQGDWPAQIYGYRTPAGALTLFGTTNATGANALQTHLVAFKGNFTVPLPQLNEVRTSWNAATVKPATAAEPTASMNRERQTITAVDTANGSYTRVIDGATTPADIFLVNKPLTGMLERSNRAPVYVMPLPGTGASVAVNAPNNTTFIYSQTLTRP